MLANTKQPQRGVAKRAENKVKREALILQRACELIAKEGTSAFTLSQLAKAAKVSVPTIHNLLGKKTDIFKAIVQAMEDKTNSMLMHLTLSDPISVIEDLVNSMITLYRVDEALYKAAFAIGESENLYKQEIPDSLYEKSLTIAQSVCRKAVKDGLLVGRVDSSLLAKLLFANQRLVRRDWMHGYISLDTYKRDLLSAIYLTLAADATKHTHQLLMEKIENLQGKT